MRDLLLGPRVDLTLVHQDEDILVLGRDGRVEVGLAVEFGVGRHLEYNVQILGFWSGEKSTGGEVMFTYLYLLGDATQGGDSVALNYPLGSGTEAVSKLSRCD